GVFEVERGRVLRGRRLHRPEPNCSREGEARDVSTHVLLARRTLTAFKRLRMVAIPAAASKSGCRRRARCAAESAITEWCRRGHARARARGAKGAHRRRRYASVGRNLFTPSTPNATKIASTTSCAIANGGSCCVGASAWKNSTFWNVCTTATKQLK